MDRVVNLQGIVEEKKEEDQSIGYDQNSQAAESGSDDGGLPTVGQTGEPQAAINSGSQAKQTPNKSSLHPREHLNCEIKQLHGELMRLLQLQISSTNSQETELALKQQSQRIQDRLVQINQFMIHLRRMEGVQQMANALKAAIEQRNKVTNDMEAQIKETKEYLLANLDA